LKTSSYETANGEVYLIQHYVIKFVSDLQQLCGFLSTRVSSTNKTDRHDITEILLKVAFNTINQSINQPNQYEGLPYESILNMRANLNIIGGV